MSNDCNFHLQWKTEVSAWVLSPFSPLPLYFAVLSLLRLLLCVFCQVLILFMTLSCVPTVKTPDKTSVSATKSAGSLLHLPLTRERQGRLWLQMCSLFPDVQRRRRSSRITPAGFGRTPWDGGEDLAEL